MVEQLELILRLAFRFKIYLNLKSNLFNSAQSWYYRLIVCQAGTWIKDVGVVGFWGGEGHST